MVRAVQGLTTVAFEGVAWSFRMEGGKGVG